MDTYVRQDIDNKNLRDEDIFRINEKMCIRDRSIWSKNRDYRNSEWNVKRDFKRNQRICR